MPSKEGEQIAIEINDILAKLHTSQSDHCIYRVHHQLRMVNEKAYDPEIIAIGPYHRGKEKIKMMEEHKFRYLKSALERRNETVEIYIEAMNSILESATKCYAEIPYNLKASEFIKMLILDGCFIVELLHKFYDPSLIAKNDPIFVMDWILNSLQRDLLLFENQIPFFVLFKLFNMIKVPRNDINFIELAMRFFYDLTRGKGRPQIEEENWHEQTKHLLGLIYNNWLPPFAGRELSNVSIRKQNGMNFILSATQLTELAGVKFEQGDEETCLLDIRFKDGTIQIPRLILEDRTESFFRNLIAYEQYCQDINHSHIISYTKFLDCLINSPDDVEILCRCGIIENWLGDYEAVSEIFNKINDSVTTPSSHFHYIDLFNDMNDHCNSRWNRWMAKLKRKYLNSPWGVISILTAFAILLFSLIQSICAIISDK